jgi:tRNA pseudouridine32 synthase / 23S rRNA pseudouridine746 synthase
VTEAVLDYTYAPPSDPIRVIHCDAHLLVVDKPAGLLTVPGKGADKADCLIGRLGVDYPDVLLVHRLDTDTSGVIVFALTRLAQGHLGKQFEHRQTQKAYVARVWGDVAGDEGRVDLPLIVDWPNRPRQHVNHATGRPARTDWRVLSRGDQETRMELRPLTGRSHQLRVHMAALGHPILGDPLYATGPAADFPRLMLHAQMIGFRHPKGGAPVRFESPIPF